VDVRILGPLEVRSDGRPVEIGGGRQRALLVLLALHANEVLSSDRLIDALWGETPPATAPKALQGLVSQLRRSLGNGVLETRAPGYLVRLDPEALDSTRFERLLAEGRRLLSAGDAAAAASKLRAALALWRGRALAEFGYDEWTQGEIRRLEALRLEAVEERIDADLALGAAADLVAELEALVAAHPLRERLRGQLMLALYRSGRQADALETFGEGRRALVEELGIEPGPELQRLQRAILEQDPALSAEVPRAAAQPGGPRRRPRVLVAAATVALVGGAAVAGLLLARGDGAPTIVPDSLVRIDPETNEVVEVVPVGSWPEQLANAGRFVFAVNVDDGTVSRLDTSSGEVRTFAALETPVGIAAEDDKTVWVGSNTVPQVARVDAETLQVRRRVDFDAAGTPWVATGGGFLWVTHQPAGARCVAPERASGVDLTNGRVAFSVETGNCPISVAYGEQAAWVVNYGDSTVTRIDPADGSSEQFPVGNQAGDVTTGFGSVWVTSDREDAVFRLNPATGRPTAIVSVSGETPWDVAAGAGSIWVTSHGPEGDPSGTLTRIDPETNRVTAAIELDFYPNGVVAGADGVWMTVAQTIFPVSPG
jgi:DNA-binding SARP family transcriptional activator/streptogramin lyase